MPRKVDGYAAKGGWLCRERWMAMPRKVDGYAVRCCRHIDLIMRSNCCHGYILRNYLKNNHTSIFCAIGDFLSKGGWVCRLN